MSAGADPEAAHDLAESFAWMGWSFPELLEATLTLSSAARALRRLQVLLSSQQVRKLSAFVLSPQFRRTS